MHHRFKTRATIRGLLEADLRVLVHDVKSHVAERDLLDHLSVLTLVEVENAEMKLINDNGIASFRVLQVKCEVHLPPFTLMLKRKPPPPLPFVAESDFTYLLVLVTTRSI